MLHSLFRLLRHVYSTKMDSENFSNMSILTAWYLTIKLALRMPDLNYSCYSHTIPTSTTLAASSGSTSPFSVTLSLISETRIQRGSGRPLYQPCLSKTGEKIQIGTIHVKEGELLEQRPTRIVLWSF